MLQPVAAAVFAAVCGVPAAVRTVLPLTEQQRRRRRECGHQQVRWMAGKRVLLATAAAAGAG